MPRRAALLLMLLLVGCAGVQRAEVGAPVAEVTAVDVGAPAAVPTPTEGRAQGGIFKADASSIEITSRTLFASFRSRITRVRGRLSLDPEDPRRGRVVLDFDMTSFENPSRTVTAILQYEFLEVDRFPRARLDATFAPSSGDDDERLVTGTLDLHGVRRSVSFKANVTRAGDGYRLTSTFDLDRQPFAIRQHDEWDWLNKDDFRVRIDMRAAPERVTAEELP